jgi:uncharacterized protein (DUF1330 family)
MAKGYWIATYKAVHDTNALAEYAKAATGAISGNGGKFIARGVASAAYEGAVKGRTVIIEFPSVDAAVAAHDSPGYQAALKILGKAVEREIRIVEGVE